MNDLPATHSANPRLPRRFGLPSFFSFALFVPPLVALALLGPQSPCHALDPHRAITQYQTQRWTVTDGYPNTKVLHLEQGAFGYLWLDTAEGPVRFDGLRFSTPPPSDLLPPHAPFFQGPRGGFDLTGPELVGLALAGLEPTHLVAAGEHLWAATDNGIHSHDENGWRRRYPGRASVLLADRDGGVWAGVGDRLVAFRVVEGTVESSSLALGDGNITALLEDRESALWIATENSLLRWEDGELVVFTQDEGLPDRSVRTILEGQARDGEQEGVLWVGTDGGGIASLEGDTVTATYSTADGLASDAVLSLAEAPVGTLWIGTADAGLSRFRDKIFTTFTTEQGLPSDSVTALLADDDGSLWVGTLGGGLGRLRGSRFETFTADSSDLASDFIRSLHRASDGAILVGTEGGLSRWQENRLETIAYQDDLAGDLVLSVLDDGDRLWLGTNAGLVRFQHGEGRVYDRGDGLLSETVHQIQKDDERLWLCTNKGLFGLRLRELDELDAGRRTEVAPLRPRGSTSHECNGYSQPASLRSAGGRLWFAALDGLLALRPEKLRPDPLPQVRIERLTADGKPLDFNKTVDLDAPVLLPGSARTIDLRIASSSLRGAHQQTFQYRLANYSAQWTQPSQRRSMRYTNLGPGTYRFEARATSRGPQQSGAVASVVFEIPRPFYRTPIFATGMFLFLVVLSRGLYHLRLQQILQRNTRLSEKVIQGTSKVLEQKQELDGAHRRLALANEKLRQANEQLFELDLENTDLLALAAHGLRGPLLNLQGFSAETERALEKLQTVANEVKDLLTESDRRGLENALFEETPEALSFIRASTDRMDQLIQGILTLASLGRQKLAPRPLKTDEVVQDILRSLSFQVNRSGARVTVNPLPEIIADPQALRLVFENLLHNAILYLSPERPGRISISSEGEGDIVVFHVRDNGVGIDPKNEDLIFQLFGRAADRETPGEGMGLTYVRAVLERQGGKIWFRSELGQGTTFSFQIPRIAVEDLDSEEHS